MIVILMGRLLISLNRSTLAQLELGQEENFVGSGQGREVHFETIQNYRPMQISRTNIKAVESLSIVVALKSPPMRHGSFKNFSRGRVSTDRSLPTDDP